MKRIVKSFALLAVAASALVSCKGELTTPEEKPQTGKFEYTFTLGAPETKAVLASDSEGYFAQWEEGDQLGIYTLNNELETTNNTAADIDISMNPVQFKVVTSYALDERSEVYAYFPYDANNSTEAEKDPSAVVLSIPASQTGSLNAMPMAAKPYAVTKPISVGIKPIADIKMRNLGSILNFNVFSSVEAYRSETVSSIAFTASTPLCGSFTYDITTAELADITGYEGTAVTVTKNITPGNDKASGNTVPMVVAPNATDGYTGTIVVTTNVATYTYTISSPIKIDRSIIKKVNVDLGSSNADRQLNDQVYFIETFDATDGTGGNDNLWKNAAGSGTVKPDHDTAPNDKWTFASAGGADRCVKLGTGQNLGSAQTPGITAAGNVKLTFKVAGWDASSENTTVALSCDNASVRFNDDNNVGDTDAATKDITLIKGEWKTFTFSVKNFVSGAKIKISAKNSSNNRFFLDNVAVYSGTAPDFTIHPTAITLNKTAVTKVAGQTEQLNITAWTPAATSDKSVTWSSNNTDVAEVSETGLVTTKVAGEATITATSNDDSSVSASCVVTVEAEKLVMSEINVDLFMDHLYFSWPAVTNASSYSLSFDNGVSYTTSITETHYDWTGLTAGDTKVLYVKAVPENDGTRYATSEPKYQSGTCSNLSYIELLISDMTNLTGSYGDRTDTKDGYTWKYNACSQSMGTPSVTYIQMRNNSTISYIQIPEVNGSISSIVATGIHSGSSTPTAFAGKLYLRSSKTNNESEYIAMADMSGNTTKNASQTITVSAENIKTGYFMTNSGLRFLGIRVYYIPDGKHDITLSKSVANGTITVDKTRAAAGETVTLGNAPSTGYELSSYDVKDASNNPVDVSDGAFTMPDSDVTVSGTFSKVNYAITDASGSNGTISFSKNPANYQDVVTIYVNPETGYRMTVGSLKAYKTGDEQTSVAISESNTITMPAYPVTVECQFKDASIKETLNTPSISSASGTTTAVSGSWGEVSHASGYNWYVSTANTWGSASDASVKASGSVKSNSLSGAALGTTLPAGDYYLYVQAVGNTEYYNNSQMSEGKKYTVTASNRITTLEKLTTGNYVIVGQQKDNGFGKLKHGTMGSNRIPYTQAFTSVQSYVTTTDADEKWLVTVSVSDSKTTITLKNIGQSKYIGGTLSWQTNASNALSFEVSVDKGVFKLKNSAANNYLGVNTTSDWWKVYAASNLYSSGSCIYFYKID